MTRPQGKHGNTGLIWAGLQRGLEESLHWASRDDDPRCVIVSAAEAIEAGHEALKEAKSQRQRDMTGALLEVAHKIKKRGESDLESGVMGDTD